MIISYNWLRDLIDFDLAPEKLAAELTRVGLAVDSVHPHGSDHVLDIDLTSNRPDCLSHLGVARELAVVLDRPMRLEAVTSEAPAHGSDLVRIEAPDLCLRFTARIIRGVKVGPSPQWLVDRLEAVGERSINNVADITNYVMLELGQPMHAFDLDKLTEKRIVVRRASNGETIQTLDEAERELDGNMVVICDAEKPAAIGGIMGGLASSITDSTVDVLLEVAYFNRSNIRSTSRKLNLSTEASYRFERGVDIENLTRASERAADLICQLAGGEKGDLVDVYPSPIEPNRFESKDIAAAVTRLTGLNVAQEECLRILSELGIRSEPNSEGVTTIFTAPTWRHDIAIEEDLVEEIARHVGYENIADELPPAFGAGEYQPTEHREKPLRQILADQGFYEAMSYSFIDKATDDVFELVPGLIDDRADEKYVELQYAVIEGAVRMRPTLLPGLLDAARLNFNQQNRDLKLFEIGKVFAGAAGEVPLPREKELLSILVTGGEVLEGKAVPARPMDFYDAKGAVQAALEAAGVGGVEFTVAEVKHLRPGQAASVAVAGHVVGSIGRLADDMASSYKFRQPVYVAELDLGEVLALPAIEPAYRPLSRYPGITRDISLLVKRDTSFDAVCKAVIDQGFELCRSVAFVDVYEGKGLADDERSLTIRLEYRSDERTLLEDEVEPVHRQIVAVLEQKLGIKQRV